jgi:proline utilization trans-activator
VVLATRPILLHVLRSHKEAWKHPSTDPKQGLPDSATALAETCIRCSRHTYRLLSDAWVQGYFPIFDYFNTQYLFSSTTVLAISSLLGGSHSRSDRDRFNSAADILQQIAQTGNFGAKEFCEHIGAIKQSMAEARPENVEDDDSISAVTPYTGPNNEALGANAGFTMTAGMALTEPSLQEFLAEPDLNLQIFEPSFDGSQTQYWPELWGDGWAG